MMYQILSLAGLVSSFGSLFAGIGACLGVFQTKKQREASYHPELVLLRQTLKYSDLRTSFIHIPISNIGLGAAKNVDVKWSIPDVPGLVDDLNKRIAKSKKSGVSFTFGRPGFLNIESTFCRGAFPFVQPAIQQFDYILPLAVQQEFNMVEMPITYVVLVSELIGLSDNECSIPPLNLTLEYLDIGNVKKVKNLKINPKIKMMVKGEGGIFDVSLELS